MRIPQGHHLRTLAFVKEGSENVDFQGELSETLRKLNFNSIGFKKFPGVLFERYEDRSNGTLVFKLNTYQQNPPKNGNFYQILGPLGAVENVTEYLRIVYRRGDYTEDPELGDSFSHLYLD